MRRSNSLVGLILIAIAILVIAIPGWAAEKATVGLIDINKILDAHPNTQKILDAEKKLQEEMEKRQTELNEKGKGKTREEVQKLEEEMNAEWAPVRDQILKERQDLINQRYSDVIAAVKKVAESQKLTLVIRSELRIPVSQNELLEMPIVFYGGIDITDQVIEEIKNIVAAPGE
ncbi:OmpH family outer membrane protein [Candidatus Sordicultor fermentans]|jgi:Skp family chaperone for outer membrane proteins|uniref:OmpH family outer membrane protein n=1 Tax=Candidatus Sordicultor fermentans TaxID=1953203 RepID=UPI0016ADC689|nr:OmpH family outer membrane protein [Atribacterota bacterium]NLY05835.1 OmpH family outer membrane protein [Candidatus Atribacteria bacterium]MDI9606999.1 OmpH family outer membrane protein [Atribacterota bacterium]MDY0134978.1 OmpH family outer membrane protein [Atribacterota bacterium]HOA99679.1 OmpH family outer membrane protein [Candidatus Atribacteria bacterium]